MFQSIVDTPLTVCPKEKCRQKSWGKGKLKKLISAGGGLLFKGSGFYITDYRSESYKQSASKESSNSRVRSALWPCQEVNRRFLRGCACPRRRNQSALVLVDHPRLVDPRSTNSPCRVSSLIGRAGSSIR